MNKLFLYLIQGRKQNVLSYGYLQNESADLITLTFDFAIDDSEMSAVQHIFFPKSTWAEGRNLQLEKAKLLPDKYLYYIFIDDDASFIKGSFNEFQTLLLENRPAVGVPLLTVIKNSNRYNPKLKVQHPVAVDQQVQAYHFKVLEESFVMPLVTTFDSMSWWYACEINGFMILSKYYGFVMQFNDIIVDNLGHHWDADTKETIVADSIYLGGITPEGLEQVRKFIVENHGQQPAYQNTLFHDNNYRKRIYLAGGKSFFLGYIDYLRKGNFKGFLKLLNAHRQSFYNNYPKAFRINESGFRNFDSDS